MSRILSIDLAYKKTADVGVCLIEKRPSHPVEVSFPSPARLGLNDGPNPGRWAEAIYAYCQRQKISLVMLDGPQGWKDPDSELEHSRVCERILNAPAKTGTEGRVKPTSDTDFVEFSIALFRRLFGLGASLVEKPTVTVPPKRILAAEILPLSAWRKLAIAPLPSKDKANAEHVRQRLHKLETFYRLRVPDEPNHDELQALVGGLAGLAILENNTLGYTAHGVRPNLKGGVIVEGFIINPRVV